MPMGYDIGSIGVTATTTASLVASLLTTSTAAKPGCAISGVWADVGGATGSGTAGGGYLIGNTWQTVGVQTTATAANKKNFFNPAANTGCAVLAANGSVGTGTQTSRISVGYAQTGGQNFWLATTPDNQLMLPPGGSTNGYADFTSRTLTASILLNWNVEFNEGS